MQQKQYITKLVLESIYLKAFQVDGRIRNIYMRSRRSASVLTLSPTLHHVTKQVVFVLRVDDLLVHQQQQLLVGEK